MSLFCCANADLKHLCYFAIISICSTFTETANYPGTKLLGVAFKLRKRMENSPPCVHVLHIWSFHFFVLQRTAKKCKFKRTCRAFSMLIKPLVLGRCHCCRCCLSSLLSNWTYLCPRIMCSKEGLNKLVNELHSKLHIITTTLQKNVNKITAQGMTLHRNKTNKSLF